MARTTAVKNYINQWLKIVNLRLDTLTVERVENRRLEALAQSIHFSEPAFPLPAVFGAMNDDAIIHELHQYRSRFADFEDAACNDVGYTFDNHWFSSPDAEVLYAIVRKFQPRTVIEVGCGHSTKVLRQATVDGQLPTRLLAIDPHPRTEIGAFVGEVYHRSVETLGNPGLFRSLTEGDILFIDSSHAIHTGGDTVFLYLNALPELSAGVLVHIHDVFLPYDYPKAWVMAEKRGWNEQYLVQAMLMFSNAFEVLWAGHYLQHTRPDFAHHFPHLQGRVAKSLWLRKTGCR